MPTAAETGNRAEQGVSEQPVVIKLSPPPGWGLLAERWLPLTIGLPCGITAWRIGYLHLLSATWANSFLDKVVSATAIFVAYLVTVVAVLPATEDKKIIRQLKQWGYFPQLIGYIGSAIWSLLALLMMSVSVSALNTHLRSMRTVDGVFSALWWFLLGFSFTAFVRATRLMLKLLVAW